MPILNAPVGRIRDVAKKIREKEDLLMSNRKIDVIELSKIHTELALLKKELSDLEKRTK